MKMDFTPLKLELLKFSQYKICDIKGTEASCKSNIKKIQELRDNGDEKKKYITTFIISEEKVIARINSRLDKFKLQFFNDYSNEKENIRIVSYCFDTENKRSFEKYHTFLATCSQFDIKGKAKNDLITFKYTLAPLFALFSGLTLFFTYFGFTEYGIPDSYISDIASISFLMIATLVFSLIAAILFFGIVIYLLVPLLICANIGCSFFISILVIGIYLVLVYIFMLKKYPLLLSELHEGYIDVMRGVAFVFIFIGIITFGGLMSQSILSTFFKNSNFYDKTGYEMIVSIYFTNYLGYPKMLKKDEKYYYLPIKDARYYYVYDIEDVKKRHMNDLKKSAKQKKKICKNIDTKKAFKASYILDNRYIKPKYLTKKFLIKNNDVTIEDFDMRKMINNNDIEDLCRKNSEEN